jgi:hypothetical protein
MAKPIAPWEGQATFSHPDLVWFATLDGRYQIEVQRASRSTGNLCIFDHADGDKELANWLVPLAYGAVFGPDVDDVAQWQDKVLEFIDNRKA